MLRRLLACLALLTGLVAAGAPTHAEVTVLATKVEASTAHAVSAQAQVASAMPQPSSTRDVIPIDAIGVSGVASHVAPTVRLRSDRARE